MEDSKEERIITLVGRKPQIQLGKNKKVGDMSSM